MIKKSKKMDENSVVSNNTHGFIRIPGIPPLNGLPYLPSLPPLERNSKKSGEYTSAFSIESPVRLKPISELLQEYNKRNFEEDLDLDYHSRIRSFERREFKEIYDKAFIKNSCIENDEETEDQKLAKVLDLSDKLRRTSYKPFAREIEMDNPRRMKIRKLSNDLGRMCISNYCIDTHHHIWATLIDLKSLFKTENEPELSNNLLEILKEIRQKFINEGIPSSGAGNHNLYE
jgi:hypothetical protein